jgi:lipopolysaccharide/colanic/teichoic acid biosynthesis glycosyltransferase
MFLRGNPWLTRDYFARLAGKQVLEIGCGAGPASCLFAESGAHVAGIDLTEAGVEMTRRHTAGLDVKVERIKSATVSRSGPKSRSMTPDERIESLSSEIEAIIRLHFAQGPHVIPIRTPEGPCAKCSRILANSNIIEFGNLQTIMIHGPRLSISDLCIKRALDLILATVGLIVLSPLFMVVSIAIKLDSRGPIFFRQRRHGFNNREIRVFKFRSMTTLEDGDQFKQVIEKDMRVTLVGDMLRKYNIDELPQLLTVLRGDMSIVGPRPHPTALNKVFEQHIRALSRRHNVKPGITGWAQINGLRGATDTLEKMQRRIEYDFYYLDNWSFLFDLKIIAMTVFSKQAYLNAF